MKKQTQLLFAVAVVPMLSACARQLGANAPIQEIVSVAKTQVVSVAHAQVSPAVTQSSTRYAPTFRADDFSDFVGINGAPIKTRIYQDGPFKGAGTTFDPQVFYDLGIRHYRMALKYDLTLPDQPQQVLAAFKKSGAQALMLIDPNKSGTPSELVNLVRQYAPNTIGGIEGPNELNNKFPPQNLNLKYKGQTDEAAGSLYMSDVYAALKADAKTKSIPVVAFTAIFTDYRLAKPHDAFDYSSMHSYQNYDVPSSSLLQNITRFNNILPIGGICKPFVPTECGYNVEADVTNGTFKTGSLRAQALNIPMLLAEYFRHGIKRTYLFATQNADGYGLQESDLKTKRPSYFALKNFLSQIKDATWNPQTLKWNTKKFAPRALIFNYQAPPTIHSVTLQKSNGEYTLMIWNEVKNLDPDAKKDIINAPIAVSLKLQTPVQNQVTILTQNDKGAYDTTNATIQNGVLNLQVPSSVMLVKIKPQGVFKPEIEYSILKTPVNVVGTATEKQVDLTWAKSPSSNVAGYFVWRNDEHVATTSADELKFTDATAWVRPGLGYRYAVQAFDKSGNLSPKVEKIVKTAPKFPDLVPVSVEIPNVQAGQTFKLKGTYKNIGEGATPNDVVSGMTFLVDGGFTAYATTGGQSVAPGESITLEAQGGPSPNWKATAGTHVLRLQIDDINRVSGESNEYNNDLDRGFFIGTTKGKLLGASDPSPYQIDLTKEGPLDWINWGLNGKDSVVKKAGGKGGWSAVKDSGPGYRDATLGSPVRLTWSDGDTTKTQSGTNAGLWLNGVNHGFEFSAIADTTERVMKIYVSGLNGIRGKFVAHLSDDSAPDYVSTTWNGNAAFDWAPVPGNFMAVYTVRYKAASPQQTLKIQWILDGEPNSYVGQSRLQAATLALAK